MECVVGDISVYYESCGAGIPIILLHGFGSDHRLMKACMEPIFAERSGWRRIYLDLPGMGRTPGKDRLKSTDDMLDVVVDVIDTVIPGQQFLIVGESYGGYLSRGVLLRKFDQVDGMALICPGIFTEPSRRDVPPHTVIVENAALLAELDPADAAEFGSVAVVQDHFTWERFRDEILAGASLADVAFLQRIKQHSDYSFAVDQILPPFPRPVVILVGRQDDKVGYRDAWRILENYPRGTFAVLDRAGHNLQIEQPQVFNALLGEWLDRVREFTR